MSSSSSAAATEPPAWIRLQLGGRRKRRRRRHADDVIHDRNTSDRRRRRAGWPRLPRAVRELIARFPAPVQAAQPIVGLPVSLAHTRRRLVTDVGRLMRRHSLGCCRSCDRLSSSVRCRLRCLIVNPHLRISSNLRRRRGASAAAAAASWRQWRRRLATTVN